MVLVVELPPSAHEPVDSRVQAQVTGYNTAGLWNLGLGGIAVPNWSGLQARNRGSNTYLTPWEFYYKPSLSNYLAETYPYTNLLDTNNWNPGSPPLYLVSDRHFLACKHFTGASTTSTTITLLGNNGQIITRVGTFLSTKGDLNLYEFDPPLTEQELQHVTPYEIVDPVTVPSYTMFWAQTPNGSFVAYQNTVTASVSDTGGITMPHDSLVGYNTVNQDFPIPLQFWVGDSGTPLLVTHNGQTYLYGAFYLSGAPNVHFGDNATWDWLAPKLATAGVTSRANLGFVGGADPTTSSMTYAAGFLEEAESNGMAFMNVTSSAAPLVYAKLVGPVELIKNARISRLQITPGAPLTYRFKCELIADGGVLFTNSDFNSTNAAELTHDYKYVTGFIKNVALDCFFTYVFREDLRMSTPPIEAGGQEYWLGPAALEPIVGLTTLVSNQLPLDVNVNYAKTIVELKAGTNYDISSTWPTNVPAVLNLGVVAGAGTGLQPCIGVPTTDEFLTSINGLTPDSKGAVNLAPENAGCLSLDADLRKNRIKLDSHCAPCCRCTDYEGTQRFVKAYGIIYARLAKEFNRIAKIYNSVATQFANELACCSTHDRVNPRFRTWPQQNFKLQIQALAENNKKVNVCLCSTSLRVSVFNAEAMTATETITSLDGSTAAVQHTLEANTPLMIAVLKEGAYVYFKGVNPGAQVISTLGETGFLTVTADVAALPIPSACSTSAALPANCMEPCTGYIMLTAGLVIVDPTFRKIVNLNNTTYPITTGLHFSYEGTENCEPCSSNVIADTTRTIYIAPNKKSVNPCAPVKAQSITKTPAANPDDPDVYRITFPEFVYIGPNGAQLELNLKVFDAAAEQYVSCGIVNLGLSPNTSGTEFVIQTPSGSEFAIPPSVTDPVGFIYTASYPLSSGQGQRGLYSRCLPNPDSFEYVNVPVSPFSVGLGVEL